VSPHFIAGFFLAWTAIYIAAAAYCIWSAKREIREPGDVALASLCLILAMFGAAAVAFSLAPAPSRIMVAIAAAASLLAPPALLDYVSTNDPEKKLRPWVIVCYGVFTIFAVVTAGAVLVGRAPTEISFTALTLIAPGEPTYLTTAGKVATAFVLMSVAYREGRLFIAEQRGLGSFLGAVALAMSAAHDAALSAAGGSTLSLASFGYAMFALGLFLSQLARFTARRERLVRKTKDLSERSQALTRAFKELRAAQTELVRKEQLAAIGELSAVVAHEVRNPLAVISNAVSTLRREDVAPEDRDTLLKILEEETHRLNQLVGDLLHYAKPLAPESQLVAIRELIERAIVPFRTRASIGIDIIEPDPVGRVAGDPMLLRQAIDNVVNNAVQAMPSGGTLTVVLERAGEGRNAKVLVTISDTGEGMDTVVRKRALDPFFTTRPSGTGLGLAIVARVVDAHGGELTLRSSPGAGTEVALALPVTPTSPKDSNRPRRLSLRSLPELRESLPPEAPPSEEGAQSSAAGGD